MAKMTLDELVTQLRAAYSGALRAVVLYGSAAGGEHHAKHSDQNVLVIVRALTLDAMNAAGAVARGWTGAGNPPPLTLTEAEWKSSVDVFAMEHADIRDRHKMLYAEPGFDPLAGMHVASRDIRQQLEYESMATLLGLRGQILSSDGGEKDRIQLLADSLSRVLALFRALLRLTGEKPGADNAAVCRAAATAARFDAGPFIAVLEHRRGTTKLAGAKVAEVLSGYHDGLERMVAFVDALPAGQ
ncbi:MAG TPA: nucleotidyltransferase domain-containing protein [Gemmatimonadaceae bacterium]|nr:nucleotidyltransferase domain-containing protein [Gemmatimonadaceae bacterium]